MLSKLSAILPVAVSILACSQITTAAATRPRPRQAPDCQHPGGLGGIDPSCWETLQLTQYTKDWWTKNSAECGTRGFATCFLGKANMGQNDCTGVKPNACTPPSGTGLSAQDLYVAYNIYAINQVFLSLYLAMGNANTLASESVGAIVTLLDPPKQTNIFLNDLLTALGAGLGIIPGPEGKIANLILSTAQQLPGIAKYLFPTGTINTVVDQWASISNEVATVVKAYQNNLAQMIPAVENDITNFLAFASTGQFSVTPLPDLSNEFNSLLTALTTFIVGKALEFNNMVLTRAIDTDINELQLNSTDDLAFQTGCGDGYDAAGICGPYWFDATAKVTYSLNNYNSMSKSPHDAMETLFANWTTGDLLFGGAARCAASGGPQGSSLAQTVIGKDGKVVLDCLSSAQICTWDVNSIDVQHEYTDCASQPGYVVDGCSGDANGCGNSDGSTASVNVPNGYVGGYLLGAPQTSCVCNT